MYCSPRDWRARGGGCHSGSVTDRQEGRGGGGPQLTALPLVWRWHLIHPHSPSARHLQGSPDGSKPLAACHSKATTTELDHLLSRLGRRAPTDGTVDRLGTHLLLFPLLRLQPCLFLMVREDLYCFILYPSDTPLRG